MRLIWQGTNRARRPGLSGPAGGAVVAALVLALVPAGAGAEIIDEKEVPRLSVGFLLGYAGNSMGRYNENISVVNHFLSTQGIPVREADKLGGGASVQGELRYKFNPQFSLGLGVASLESKSAFSFTLAEINFYARSTAISPMLYYHLPFVQKSEKFIDVADRMSLYVGAGPVILTKGSTLVRIIDGSNEPQFNADGDMSEIDGEGKATGSGGGFRGLVGGSYQLTGRFSFAAEVGYRYGKITNLKIDETTLRGFERDIGQNDPERREPLEQAIRDFYDRAQRPPALPDMDINRNHIPYYSDFEGPLELDFSGVTLQVGFRLHI